MTKSEIMHYAVAEARKMTGLSWREAMRFGFAALITRMRSGLLLLLNWLSQNYLSLCG